MTGLEIAYQQTVETHRHNVVTEGLTLRDLEERERHNRATEYISYADLTERARHNRVSESQGWVSIAESQRHNQATEWMQYMNYAEYKRSNTANEALKASEKPWMLLFQNWNPDASVFSNVLTAISKEGKETAEAFTIEGSTKYFDWMGDVNVFIPKRIREAKKESGLSWYEYLVK